MVNREPPPPPLLVSAQHAIPPTAPDRSSTALTWGGGPLSTFTKKCQEMVQALFSFLPITGKRIGGGW